MNPVMHEVGIIESALEVIRREAQAHGATRVERVVLKVGAISGAEPDALRFAFEAVTPGTVADGAELDIELVPARVHCADCQDDFTVEQGYIFECPRCRAISADIRSGRDLHLARLEFPSPSSHVQQR